MHSRKIINLPKPQISMNLNTNPFRAAEIGIPLYILQNVFTTAHYGTDITNPQNIGLQFLLGYFTYGTDRLLDSIDDINNDINTTFYNSTILDQVVANLFMSYFFIIMIFEKNIATKPLSFAITSTVYYKNFKQNFGLLKPFYIAFFWTIGSIVAPCVLHDNNYDILYSPLDYLPAFLSILGSSNIADIKDIEEDSINNITTIPVKYGALEAYKFSVLALFLANFIFLLNPHFFDRPVVNWGFEIQNLLPVFSPLFLNITL